LEDLAGITANDLGDVVLNNAGQGTRVADRRHPAGQLRVPDGSVSTDELVVLNSPVDKGVKTVEVEVALRGLDGVPFTAFEISR
jgi:hypothetical protein